MVKFTTTGIYAGFSREASVHSTMSTMPLPPEGWRIHVRVDHMAIGRAMPR